MNSIVIEIGGEPRGKSRPRFARRNGIAFTPKATRDFEAALRIVAGEQMNGRPPLEGALSVVVTATFPVPASWSKKKREAALDGAIPHTVKPDVDNLLKSIDALNSIVFHDDKQVTDARVVKKYGEVPSLRIEVTS
jgi:Holliday junction resolvase RusA-like endonuclease